MTRRKPGVSEPIHDSRVSFLLFLWPPVTRVAPQQPPSRACCRRPVQSRPRRHRREPSVAGRLHVRRISCRGRIPYAIAVAFRRTTYAEGHTRTGARGAADSREHFAPLAHPCHRRHQALSLLTHMWSRGFESPWFMPASASRAAPVTPSFKRIVKMPQLSGNTRYSSDAGASCAEPRCLADR